ncbi:hypothetical protein [Paraliobacillus sp. JSM ZJ581]|uniref:hypothetical protein n=1 Tax=Paraliobacillus sp. JSM ZJ581 TaxID=3342118 RepID=UPI0035A99AF9
MVVKVVTAKLLGIKDRFWLNTFIQVGLIVNIILVINPLRAFLGDSTGLTFTFLFIISIILIYCFDQLTLYFLNITFKQQDAGFLSHTYVSKNFIKKNKLLLQSKLEFVHFFRNEIYKEQGFFFIILTFILSLHHYLEPSNFSIIYSLILNYGLKEILIMLPLTIGIHFRKYKYSIYTLNVGKYQYFLSRLFIMYLLNGMTYFLFITISYFVTGMKVHGYLDIFFIIAFITMLSTLVGFVIKINEINKIYVLFLLLIIVNVIDMFIKQLFEVQLMVQITYISLSVMMFFVVANVYLRRPIVK